MSFKVEVRTGGQDWDTNSCRFATHTEAARYGQDLFNRWTAVTEYQVVASNDAVNYTLENGLLLRAPAAPVPAVEAVKSIDDGFRAFHSKHPEVYGELVRLARIAQHAGFCKYSIKTIWEVMRWSFLLRDRDERESFKLNNNYHSRYSRLIMENERELAGFFETRVLKA